MIAQDIINEQIQVIIDGVKNSLKDIKNITVSEAWKILQLLTATVIQLIERFAQELSGPEKKKIAMDIIGNFYDSVFSLIDLPILPSAIESLLQGYIKQVLMLLVDSAIDAMVATFRDIGVFTPKVIAEGVDNKLVDDFFKNLNKLVRI